MRISNLSAIGAPRIPANQRPGTQILKRRVVQLSGETGVPNVAAVLASKLRAKGVIAFNANTSPTPWDPAGSNLIDRHEDMVASDLTGVR